MAEIATVVHNGNSTETTTTSQTFVVAGSISSGSLVANARYALIATWNMRSVTGSGNFCLTEMRYNGTKLNRSGRDVQTVQQRQVFFTQFDAGATPGNVELMFRSSNASATSGIQHSYILLIRLDADLQENIDWVFEEDVPVSPPTLTTSWANYYTSTKKILGQRKERWLVLYGHDVIDQDDQTMARWGFNGKTGGDGVFHAAHATTNISLSFYGGRIIDVFPNSEHQVKCDLWSAVATGTYEGAAFFALRLGAFTDIQYDRPRRSIYKIQAASTIETVRSITWTPAASNNYFSFYGITCGHVSNNTTDYIPFMRLDGAVWPLSNTGWGHQNGRIFPHLWFGITSSALSVASHTFTGLHWANVVAGSAAYNSWMIAFSALLSTNNKIADGTVRENGSPVSRVVILKKESDGSLAGATKSDPTDGSWKIGGLENTTYDRIVLDDAGGEAFRDKIRAGASVP